MRSENDFLPRLVENVWKRLFLKQWHAAKSITEGDYYKALVMGDLDNKHVFTKIEALAYVKIKYTVGKFMLRVHRGVSGLNV